MLHATDNLFGRDTLCRRFAADAIEKRAAVFSKRLLALRSPRNTDAVHDARVAARRLRVALDVFEPCLPKAGLARRRRALKRAARSLGKTRDLDVQSEFLKTFLRSLGDRPLRPGIRRLLLRTRQARAEAFAEAMALITRPECGRTLKELEAMCARLRARPALPVRRSAGAAKPLQRLAQQAIGEKLEALMAFDGDLRFPERKEKLHGARVAMKNLRYALEFFSPLYDKRLKLYIERLRRFQTMLGAVHDCDVWLETLPRFLRREQKLIEKYFGRPGPIRTIRPGVEALIRNRASERAELYAEFMAAWDEAHDERFWRELEKIISSAAAFEMSEPDSGASAGAQRRTP